MCVSYRGGPSGNRLGTVLAESHSILRHSNPTTSELTRHLVLYVMTHYRALDGHSNKNKEHGAIYVCIGHMGSKFKGRGSHNYATPLCSHTLTALYGL